MYQVILIGVSEDVARSNAVKNLAALFRSTPEQVEKLFTTSGYVLKKGITAEVAGKYKAAIEAAGGTCRIELDAPQKQTLDVDIPASTPIQDTPKGDQKMTTCGTCGQNLAKTADACPKCGARNEWSDPRRNELVSYLQSHGNELVSEPWEFHGDRFSVWGHTKSSIKSVIALSATKTFRVDFSGTVPVWQSNDDIFWQSIKEHMEGKNTSISAKKRNTTLPPFARIGSVVGIALLVLVAVIFLGKSGTSKGRFGTWTCDNASRNYQSWAILTLNSNGTYILNLSGFPVSGHYTWEGVERLNMIDDEDQKRSQTWVVIQATNDGWLMSNGRFEALCHK